MDVDEDLDLQTHWICRHWHLLEAFRTFYTYICHTCICNKYQIFMCWQKLPIFSCIFGILMILSQFWSQKIGVSTYFCPENVVYFLHVLHIYDMGPVVR